ncbi:DUF4232 domain-containing protein [Streptomyces sp. CRN 30]|uniref:DUF4232 domain-containing protein n=1 Tax=Streptomyces sp. CRN 30 TaxID=3075613 RepID=UPI002A82A0E5|nr:DUF4232 domain-containing protein [Streptomyces sp. CRN 30]
MRAFRTSARPARSARSRGGLFTVSAVALAALSLTACQSGTGVQDEGASQPAPTATAKPAGNDEAKENANEEAAEGGTGSAANASQAKDSGSNTGTSTSTGSSNSNSGSSSSSTSSKGSADEDPYAPENRDICSSSNTRVTVQEVSRPLNHMLVTVTNKGSKLCDLPYYPYVRFGQVQWAPQIAESTKPQAVVTLAPGESGYAGVMLASADGSGENGETAKKVSIGFQDLNGDGAGSTTVNLPGDGVYFDSTLRVTYWQQTLENALF